MSSRKELSVEPHHGQTRIASAIGPSQRWQRKRSSSAEPKRRRKLSAWSASGESAGALAAAPSAPVRPRPLHLREGALERGVEGDGVRVAMARIEGGSLAQHGAQRLRHAREEAAVAGRGPLEGPGRQRTRQQLVGDQPEREHVGGEPRTTVGLLRRDVAEGAGIGDRHGRRRAQGATRRSPRARRAGRRRSGRSPA